MRKPGTAQQPVRVHAADGPRAAALNVAWFSLRSSRLRALRVFAVASQCHAEVAAVDVVHGLDGDHDHGLRACFAGAAGEAEFQFLAAVDHVAQHLVDGVGVRAGPFGDDFAQLRAVMAQEACGTGVFRIARRVGEEVGQVGVVELGPLVEIASAFFLIMFS